MLRRETGKNERSEPQSNPGHEGAPGERLTTGPDRPVARESSGRVQGRATMAADDKKPDGPKGGDKPGGRPDPKAQAGSGGTGQGKAASAGARPSGTSSRKSVTIDLKAREVRAAGEREAGGADKAQPAGSETAKTGTGGPTRRSPEPPGRVRLPQHRARHRRRLRRNQPTPAPRVPGRRPPRPLTRKPLTRKPRTRKPRMRRARTRKARTARLQA